MRQFNSMAITDETPMDVDVDTPFFDNVGQQLAKQGTIYIDLIHSSEKARPPLL